MLIKLFRNSILFGLWLVDVVSADYTVTVYPEYLSQNGRSHFEADRWNGHNVLDKDIFINPSKAIGTKCQRWIKSDYRDNTFHNTPEDPHRRGYSDPNYFKKPGVQQAISHLYASNIKGFGNNIVMTPIGKHWPQWMDSSAHNGLFPNNFDAAAELLVQMLEGVQHGTGGTIPPEFEVYNEPGTLWEHWKWSSVIEFHKIVAGKLKSKFPHMKVGGPCRNGVILVEDADNFHGWRMSKEFLDMALSHLDFYSFHPYNVLHSQGGSHNFTGINEARLVAVIDMVTSYAHYKKGRSIQLIFSEYGLGQRHPDSHTTNALVQWAYAYTRNGFMFTMMNHRDVIDRAVAFLIGHDGGDFVQSSIFNTDGSETFVANTYRFWKGFNYNYQFLRVEGQYDGAERTVSPLAVADPHSRKLSVLLHNYKQASARVKLVFHNKWITPTVTHSTCITLDSNRHPHFTTFSAHTYQGEVTLPSEASCFFEFQTAHNFGATPTVQEHTYFAKEDVTKINNNVVQTSISLPSSGTHHTAKLRFAITTSNKHAHVTPRSVHVNGHSVTAHYSLYDPSRNSAKTLWEVLTYNVPTNFLKHGANVVRLEFAQSDGHVTSVALVVGDLSGGSHVVG